MGCLLLKFICHLLACPSEPQVLLTIKVARHFSFSQTICSRGQPTRRMSYGCSLAAKYTRNRATIWAGDTC